MIHSNVASPAVPVVEHVRSLNDEDGASSILVVETQEQTDNTKDDIIVRYETANKGTDEIQYENERAKPKPKKRTKKKTQNTETEEEPQQKYSFENITAVTIHKTDRLQLSSLFVHPLVSVHFINSETGEYLKKSDQKRAVAFYYENKNFGHISPVLTQPYNMKNERCYTQFF